MRAHAIQPIPRSCHPARPGDSLYRRELGFRLLATAGTAKYLAENDILATRVNNVYEGRHHIVATLKDDGVRLVFKTTEGAQSIDDSRDHGISRKQQVLREARSAASQHKDGSALDNSCCS